MCFRGICDTYIQTYSINSGGSLIHDLVPTYLSASHHLNQYRPSELVWFLRSTSISTTTIAEVVSVPIWDASSEGT